MSEPRENDRKHARLLLEMARKDLKALAGMEDADTFADEIVGFHAQQAMCKSFSVPELVILLFRTASV